MCDVRYSGNWRTYHIWKCYFYDIGNGRNPTCSTLNDRAFIQTLYSNLIFSMFSLVWIQQAVYWSHPKAFTVALKAQIKCQYLKPIYKPYMYMYLEIFKTTKKYSGIFNKILCHPAEPLIWPQGPQKVHVGYNQLKSQGIIHPKQKVLALIPF